MKIRTFPFLMALLFTLLAIPTSFIVQAQINTGRPAQSGQPLQPGISGPYGPTVTYPSAAPSATLHSTGTATFPTMTGTGTGTGTLTAPATINR